MRARGGMDKSFMEAVRRLELAPISHRIAGVGLADAALVLDLVIDGETPRRRLRAPFTDVALHRHEEAVAFHDVDVLGRSGELYLHFGRVVRAMRGNAITARGDAGRSAARQKKGGRGTDAQ